MTQRTRSSSGNQTVVADEARRAYIEVSQACCLIDDASRRLQSLSPQTVMADPLFGGVNLVQLSLSAKDLIEAVNGLLDQPADVAQLRDRRAA
jgi:hypothetical protein